MTRVLWAVGCSSMMRIGRGQRRGGKSGRGAPGKTPFVAAVELNREGRPMRMRLSRVGGFRSEEIAAWARCHLKPGTVVVSDALGCARGGRVRPGARGREVRAEDPAGDCGLAAGERVRADRRTD